MLKSVGIMLTGELRTLPLTFCLLCVTASGQELKLEPGNPVERQIAGGESHSYKINLAAGSSSHASGWSSERLTQR